MKILFLADAVYQDIAGGSRVVAYELAQGLVGRGHDVTFLVARHNEHAPEDERQTDGIRVIRYRGAGKPLEFIRRGQEACAKLLASSTVPFDLIHTHFAYAAIGPMRVIPTSIPRVRTFHGPWDAEGWIEENGRKGLEQALRARLKRILRYQIEAASLRVSAQVITLSDYYHRIVTKRSCVPSDRISVIPGGTDSLRFHPTTDRAAQRKELDLPQDRRILISVRRLTPRMGLENLIRAMPTILRCTPEALLLIGGTGQEYDKLQNLIRTLDLENYVRLLGFIPDDKLPSYYQAADLFVLPTLALEGFGLVTTEALSSGLPVIGTPVGATPEILNRLEPRLVAKGTTPDALSDAILGYLEGDWAAALTPERLHRYVQENYTWENHVLATEAIYHRALGRTQEGSMEHTAPSLQALL